MYEVVTGEDQTFQSGKYYYCLPVYTIPEPNDGYVISKSLKITYGPDGMYMFAKEIPQEHYITEAPFPKSILNVAITIDEIKKGDTADTIKKKMSLPQYANYNIYDVILCDSEGQMTESIEDNGEYGLEINVEAINGGIFPGNMNVYNGAVNINGESLPDDRYGRGSDTGIYVSYRFNLESFKAAHVFGKPVKKNEVAATCTEDGGYDEVSICSVCNKENVKHVDVTAIGHKWGEWFVEKPATETEDGIEKRVCANDSSHFETRVLPKKGTTTSTTTGKFANVGTDIIDKSLDATYTVVAVENGQPVVEYKKPTTSEKTVTIPDTVTVEGVTYKIVSISPNAFKDDKTLIAVKMGANIKTIGQWAFSGCTKLKSMTLGDNVTEIGANAFANCTSLTSITLPSKTVKIGANAFANCKKLKTIKITSTKLKSKNIHKKAFKGIGKKVTIKVPKKMKKTYIKLFRKKGLSKKVKVK